MRVRSENQPATAYLCISDAELDTPRHSSRMIPVTPTSSINRVRVTAFHNALVGGICALADFQLNPPLGSNMVICQGAPRFPEVTVAIGAWKMRLVECRSSDGSVSGMTRKDSRRQTGLRNTGQKKEEKDFKTRVEATLGSGQR